MGWISVGMRPEAPAGALGGDYGDFFPQDGEEDVGFVNIRHIGTILPIHFPILILFLLFQLFIGITVVRWMANLCLEGSGFDG
jgi:hypothetical protein